MPVGISNTQYAEVKIRVTQPQPYRIDPKLRLQRGPATEMHTRSR